MPYALRAPRRAVVLMLLVGILAVTAGAWAQTSLDPSAPDRKSVV